MHYYEIHLLRSSAPKLTYSSVEELPSGTVVTVPLKSTVKSAVVLDEVEKPSYFSVESILSVEDLCYDTTHLSISKFISSYYFSSFGESLSLFIPYKLSKNGSEGLPSPQTPLKQPILSKMQQKAYAELLSKDRSLLFGVTGSGKTEIFISMMLKMISEGKRSIFLMPEISLTPQMEKRLKIFFGDRVAMWHSKLSKKKKEQILEQVYRGEISIIAGARSALFVPLENVGLIIVDEEHDDSYKAMTRPRYHARDVAVLMAQKLGAKIILASATPSVSSYHKYDVVRLGKAFIETQKSFEFVSGAELSSQMIQKIKNNYEQGHQALLFLPTRGNFKYLYCEKCGRTHLCPYCSVGMALHRYRRHLRCHYCGYTEKIVDTCTHCGHTPLKSERMGTVEAMEMIAEQIPTLKIEQFDKDSITTAKKLKDALKRFESGESQLLLGTQMLSKGHDYANITLSVIMGLDYILGLADYKAKQRAVSLLIQIAGRSGRAKAAEVIIQTNNRETFIPYLEDYELFLKDELEFVRDLYPPFVTLARILVADKDQGKAMNLTEEVVKKLSYFKEIEIVGHGKAPIEKIANKYRYTILLRAKQRVPLLKALHSINQRAIEIDIDPVDFS